MSYLSKTLNGYVTKPDGSRAAAALEAGHTHTECRYTAKPPSDFHVGAHKRLVTSHTRFLAWDFPFAFVVTF